MSIGTVAQLRSAQLAYDALAEYEPDEDIDERIHAIEAAEELLATARAELCLMRPRMSRVDMLLADAADCLIQDGTK
jgi:hypothetical protein